MNQIHTITPTWPAPINVRAFTTTRGGGFSEGPYQSFNLGNAEDDPTVPKNRELLRAALKLPAEPVWLKQVHGTDVVDAATAKAGAIADAAWTRQRAVVAVIRTADCLPVFLCNRQGTEVGIVHAGWRGLAAGVVEAGLDSMRSPKDELLAWLGPAIGPTAYEVGAEVRTAFVETDPEAASAFVPNAAGRWLADMYVLARRRLRAAGVSAIYGGDYCTASQPDLFFSYRRDGTTGRMASLIWFG